jgi:hypothetical protein
MSIDKITNLRGKAAHQLAEMRRILDENDVLTAEQAQEFDRREADLDAANETVARLEKIEGIAPAPKFAEARSIALGDDDPVSIDEGVEVSEKRDADQAFSDWLRSRGTDAEARSTMVTSAIANNRGSQWVPQNWSNQLIQSLVLQTALFDVSQVLDTQDGTTLNLPASTADESIALVAEEGSYTTPNPTTTSITLGAYKYGHIVKVSEELLADSVIDLPTYVRNQVSRIVGNQIGAVLATGTGSSQPTGINQATTGVTAASTTATTADEIVDLQHSVAAPYRANGAFFVNDTWLRNVRKLKGSGSGDYLLQPGLAAGAPATLLGSPVYIEQLAAPATGTVPAVYGDPNGFVVRRTPVEVAVLNERFADTGHIGFRVSLRIDSKIADSAALRKFIQA